MKWYELPENLNQVAYLPNAGIGTWKSFFEMSSSMQWFVLASSPFLLCIFAGVPIWLDAWMFQNFVIGGGIPLHIHNAIGILAIAVITFLHFMTVMYARDSIRLGVHLARGVRNG